MQCDNSRGEFGAPHRDGGEREADAKIRFNPVDATLDNLDTIELILNLVERSAGQVA